MYQVYHTPTGETAHIDLTEQACWDWLTNNIPASEQEDYDVEKVEEDYNFDIWEGVAIS